MEQKPSIFVVDDSPEEIHILLAELKDTFRMIASTSGEDAIKKLDKCAEQDLPDIILMDVNMPGMNGYEACHTIKENPAWRDVDLIFLSSNNSTSEIMSGFEAGATDYIVKPYEISVLQSKLKAVLQLRESRLAAKTEADQAKQFASSVLAESGNLAGIFTCLRTAFEKNDADSLMEVMLEYFRNYSLSASVFFNAAPIKQSRATAGVPSMLELELLERVSNTGLPFFEKEDKVFFIQKQLTVLIKNMPEDPDKRSSLKDNLKMLLEGIGAKLSTLAELERVKAHKLTGAYRSLERANQTLSDIQEQQEKHKQESVAILDNMAKEIEDNFFRLGLTEDQEAQLLKIVNRTMEISQDHYETGLNLDTQLKELVKDLASTARQQANI